MPNICILPQNEGVESNDTPKKFKNIDNENFELTWGNKPFGGTLGDKTFMIPGEVVVMPKYLVNYAAMNLARKIYKRKAFAEFKGTEVEKANGMVRFVNPEEEIKLMKLMVADNFPLESVLEPTPIPTIPIEIKKEEGKEESLVCEICQFKAKSKFGLMAHKRLKHK